MGRLAQYAATKNINVIVENHGGLSSDAAKVVKRDSGERWGGNCIEQYDIYKGTKELMAFAKGVSAKSHNFDADGNETKIDYVKMLQIVKDAGFSGFVGVEYEGDELGEKEGILATKNLLLSAAKKLN